MKENNYNTGFAFKPAGKQKVNIHDVSDDIKEELDGEKNYINNQSNNLQSCG